MCSPIGVIQSISGRIGYESIIPDIDRPDRSFHPRPFILDVVLGQFIIHKDLDSKTVRNGP